MNPEARAAYERWQSHRKAIQRATSVDLFEEPHVREARKAHLQQDFQAFCQHYFPHYCTAPFGKFHLDQVNTVQHLQRGLFVFIMARDHAKSVVHGVMHPIYLMVRGELKNMVVVSWSEQNAMDLLKPLQMELESNARLVHDHGQARSLSRWEDGNFVTAAGVSFRALGSGQSPRGMRNQETRPDYVLVDDLDEDALCRNPRRLDQAWDWLMGALFPAMSIAGRARMVMVGNLIAPDTLLARAEKRADATIRVNMLDAKGQPSWHQRFTLEQCQYMIKKLGERLSQREYFNNPTVEGKVFKKEWLRYKQMPTLRGYRALIAYLDPGFKKTATADSKAWILVGITPQGEYHVLRAFVEVASIAQMVGWGYELKEWVEKRGGVAQLFMEEVFLQDLLYEHFRAEGAKRGAQLPVRGDKRHKPDKDARIEAMSGLFERGHVYFNAEFQDEHNMVRLQEQLTNFQPGVKTAKDGPDALEGAVHLLQLTVATAGDITIGSRATTRHKLT